MSSRNWIQRLKGWVHNLRTALDDHPELTDRTENFIVENPQKKYIEFQFVITVPTDRKIKTLKSAENIRIEWAKIVSLRNFDCGIGRTIM